MATLFYSFLKVFTVLIYPELPVLLLGLLSLTQEKGVHLRDSMVKFLTSPETFRGGLFPWPYWEQDQGNAEWVSKY